MAKDIFMENLTEAEVQRAENKFCMMPDCYHYAQDGYIYCITHIYGVSPKLTDADRVLKDRYIIHTAKNLYFNHFINYELPSNIQKADVQRIRDKVLGETEFWFSILVYYNGRRITPEYYKITDKSNFDLHLEEFLRIVKEKLNI